MANHIYQPQIQSIQSGMYSSSKDRNGSTSSLSYKPGWDAIHSPSGNHASGQQHDEQPSFQASTSSLPGALGVPSSAQSDSASRFSHASLNSDMDTSASPISSTYARRIISNGNSSYETTHSTMLSNQNDQQTRRHYSSGFNGMDKNHVASNNAMNTGQTNGSLNDSHESANLNRSRNDSISSNGSAATTASASNANNNMRNFLVPIGATGARQKLSILSASQRPRTAQSAITPSFGSSSGGISGSFVKTSSPAISSSERIGSSNRRARPTTSEGHTNPRTTFQRSESDLQATRRMSSGQRSVDEPAASIHSTRDDLDDDVPSIRSQSARRKASFEKASRIMGTSGFASMSNPPSTTRTRRKTSAQGAHDPNNSSKGSGVYANSGAHSSSGSISSIGGGSNHSRKGSLYKHRSGSQSSLHSLSSLRDVAQSVFGGSKNAEKEEKYDSGVVPQRSTSQSSAAGNPGNKVNNEKQSIPTNREGLFGGLGRSVSSGTVGESQTKRRPRSSSGTKDIAEQVKTGFKSMFSRSGKNSRPSTAITSISSPQPVTGDQLTSNTSFTQYHPNASQLSQQTFDSGRQPQRQQSIDRTGGWQHSRTSSNTSGRMASTNYAHEDLPNQDNARLPSNGSWTSPLLQHRVSEESNEGGISNAAIRPRIAGRLPSKEYASAYPPSASRPRTAPSVKSFDSVRTGESATNPDEIGEQDRSKTPILSANNSGRRTPTPRRPSNSSEWSNNTQTASTTVREYENNAGLSSFHPYDQQEGRRELSLAETGSRISRDLPTNNANARRLESGYPGTLTNTGLPMQERSPESTYSAPNSSRNFSPTVSDRPSVPLTSPLLASVLGQQSLSPITIPAMPVQSSSRQIKAVDRSNSTSTISRSPSTEDSVQVVTPSTSSLTAISTPSPKPAIPTKSRNRIASMQTLDDGLSPVYDQPSSTTSSSYANSSIGLPQTPTQDTPTKVIEDEDSVKTKTPTKGTNLEDQLNQESVPASRGIKSKDSTPQIDPSTFVPPDALLRTRRGLPVRKTTMDEKSSNENGEALTNKGASESGAQSQPISAPYKSPLAKLELSNSPLIQDGYSWTPTKSDTATPSTGKGTDGQIITFNSSDYDPFDGDDSADAISLLPTSAWAEVEASLLRFKAIPAQSTNDKGQLLRTVLLPFLALEAETPDTRVTGSGPYQAAKARRKLFFDWIRQLLIELQSIQTSADRGAILESIACIIESRNFNSNILENDAEDQETFFGVLGHILNYAIGELNKKGVYQNTLIFSGRLLAVAFFRIEGVASKLLRALPVNRFALERVANEAQWNDRQPVEWEKFKGQFSTWLHDFCFEDARSYLKMLDSQSGQTEEDDRFLVRQEHVEVEMSGNWLRRWQSDDSELFFSFCRSYHRQLAGAFASQQQKNAGADVELDRQLFFGGPGFAHLATCIHQKCLSLVHRDILSVTTLSSQKNFNPGETANVLSGSTAGKPRHLEAANRRCTAIVVDIVRTSSATTRTSMFAAMLGIHVKCLVKRTSLYDVQGVFCLLDWLDGVLSHMENAEMVVADFVDIDFLLQTVWLLLKDADHALALMRTIAFCYSNFAVLTDTQKHRERFFEDILLNPAIFQKLFLSWSFTIRAYFLHLLVFRLARINDFSNPDDDPKGKTSVRVIKLFNKRLDEIRKRHDELSPAISSSDSQSEGEDEDDFARFKRRPQSFVSTIRHTPSVHKMETSASAVTKAERVLGIGLPDPVLSNKAESKAQSRAAKWLRALGGKGSSKGNKSGASLGGSGNKNMTTNVPKIINQPRNTLPRLDEIDIFSDEDETEAENETNRSGFTARESDDGDLTPRAEDGLEFHFEPKAGHKDVSNAAANDVPNDTSALPAANEHINSEMSFDLQNPLPGFGNLPDGNSANDPSQQRISRAFSRRRSLLPGPAYSLVHGESESEGDNVTERGEDDQLTTSGKSSLDEEGTVRSRETPTSDGLINEKNRTSVFVIGQPYDRTLHIYAVQSLREYEQTVQEHDDFFSSQEEAESPQVPRLPIQWPAMWSE